MRREVYLHVNGPGWSEVVPFALKNSTVDAKQLHRFANAINVQAANVAGVRAAIATRIAKAQQALGAALLDRSELGGRHAGGCSRPPH